MRGAAYRKAYEDVPFLKREELRPVRLQLELLKPELCMQAEHVESTVVCFGSTRIRPRAEAMAVLEAARRALAAAPRSRNAARRVATAERLLAKSRYYDEARRFGRIVSAAGQADGAREFVVITGGGPGIMEAANRGAFEIGARTIGLGISLPHEQRPNAYISPELNFHFHYFALRKMHFMLRAKAIVAFPGGYGTLDELCEVLTLVQTRKVPRIPIILMGREFWTRVLDLPFLVAEGVIDPRDARLVQHVETAEEAWAAIRAFYGLPLRTRTPRRPAAPAR
jgi:uncharacterized protein (TIGR00730 family)